MQAQLAVVVSVPWFQVTQIERRNALVSIGDNAEMALALALEFTSFPARQPAVVDIRKPLA